MLTMRKAQGEAFLCGQTVYNTKFSIRLSAIDKLQEARNGTILIVHNDDQPVYANADYDDVEQMVFGESAA